MVLFRGAALVLLLGLGTACPTSDSTDTRPCGSSLCGFYDHKYFATFYCPMGMGYSYRDPNHCLQECASAVSFGCDAGSCASGCAEDHGTGQWLACTEANNGTVTSSGCFLAGSDVSGETVSCVCG
jgi:hypothetical protein